MALVVTVLALFFATKDSIHQHTLGWPITWGKNLWWKAMEWYAWGALSPLIERSVDLTTWMSLMLVTNETGIITWTNQQSSQEPATFFRAMEH